MFYSEIVEHAETCLGIFPGIFQQVRDCKIWMLRFIDCMGSGMKDIFPSFSDILKQPDLKYSLVCGSKAMWNSACCPLPEVGIAQGRAFVQLPT